MAGQLLFSGSTLFVIANPNNTFSNHEKFLRNEFDYRYNALSLGASFADFYTILYPGTANHYFGDPTITFRDKILHNNPLLRINEEEILFPFKHEVSFDDANNEEIKYLTLSFKNISETDLLIKSESSVAFAASFNDEKAGNTSGFVFQIIEPSPHNGFELRNTISPNDSLDYTIKFNPNAPNDPNGTGQYRGVFTFTTNDPSVPAFNIIVNGNHIVQESYKKFMPGIIILLLDD